MEDGGEKVLHHTFTPLFTKLAKEFSFGLKVMGHNPAGHCSAIVVFCNETAKETQMLCIVLNVV